jgi:hypothetical protein
MHINTKVVFEWDQDKQEYSEVYSEGYEYSGDVDLAHMDWQEHYHTGARQDVEYGAVFGQGSEPPGQEEDPYSGPTGYQDYQSLWDLSQGGSLADYLKNEFKIGKNYMKYITPFSEEPFEFLETGLGLEQEGLRTAMGTARSATTRGLGEARSAVDTAYARSNMVNVGGITKGFEQQKDKLMEALKQSRAAYDLGMEQAQLGYETDVYGERKTQEERFYDDIARIIQMKQG